MKELLWIIKIFELDIEMNAWGFYFLYPIFVVYSINELCVWPVFRTVILGHFEAQTIYLRGPKKGIFSLVTVTRNGNVLDRHTVKPL